MNKELVQGVKALKNKMKLINFTHLQPPYLLHTVTKFRESQLKGLLKEGDMSQVLFVIQQFDDECFDAYVGQLSEPYIRKMFQDNYGFDDVDFKEANKNYHLKGEIQETLCAAAEWLTQVEVTQDLLQRIELYFKIKAPTIMEKVKQQGYASEKASWIGSISSGLKKILSFSLRKGSKVVQRTFFSTLAPSFIMITLAIIGGTSTLPFNKKFDFNSLVPAIAAMAVPLALDSIADGLDKSECSGSLKRWAKNFTQLSEKITKFNEILEESIKNCVLTKNPTDYEKQRTSKCFIKLDLQKIVKELSKNISTVTNFDEQKLQQMRERTEAYFRQYVEIKEGDWTVVIPKQDFPK